MLSLHIASCSANISKVISQFPQDGPGPIPYVYLGKDFLRLRHWEQKLGSHFTRIDIAHLLDDVAQDILEDYVHWLDQLNRRYGWNPEWWFGTISTRHVYQSNIFQYGCYLETLRRLWAEPQRRPHLVVVESCGLADAVVKWARQNGIPIIITDLRALYQELEKKIILSVLRWAYFTFKVIIRAVAAFASREKQTLKNSSPDPLAIVDTFIHESCWPGDGTYKDRYFPGLFDFLQTQGFKVLIHPVLHGFRAKSYLSAYRKMRQGSETFIIPEDFLQFSDYLSVLTFPWRYSTRKIEAPPFMGFDLQDVLHEEKITLGDTSGLVAALIYRLFLRLGETSLQPQIIISWYENQMIDKALIAGARRAFPGTEIIGAQIFMHFGNLFSEAPSQSEVEAGVAPHILLATSKHQCQGSQAFVREIPCLPAAALRYAHLFEPHDNDGGKGLDGYIILVLLPFLLEDAVQLLSMLTSALEHFSNHPPLWVKCHPDYSPTALKKLCGPEPWLERFNIFEGSMHEALGRASVVISSGTSAIAETLAWGIPVLMVGKQTSITPVVLGSEETGLMRKCFTVEELATALKQFVHQPEPDIKGRREKGEKIRGLFFTPVTLQTMMPYLGLAGADQLRSSDGK